MGSGGLSGGTAHEVTGERAGKELGDTAELVLAGVDQVIEGWLEDLSDSGNGLLETHGTSRLRRLLKRSISQKPPRSDWDGSFSHSSPSDLEAAARALRQRVSRALPPDKQSGRSRRALLAAARSLAAAHAKPASPPQEPLPSELTGIVSRAALALQKATTPSGVTRAILDAALHVCRATGAVWWKQQESTHLSAHKTRGLRLAGRARTIRIDPNLWQAASHGGRVVALSPEDPNHASLLETVGAERALLLRARAGDDWVGALTVHDGNFGPERVDLLAVLTQQAGLALHALALRAESAQLAGGQLQAAAELDSALSSAVGAQELLHSICRSAARLLRVECCLLFLAEPGDTISLRASECPGKVCRRLSQDSLLELAERARTQPKGQPLWRSGRRLPVPGGRPIEAAGVKSLLGLSISLRGEPLGALLLLSPRAKAFTAARRELMISFVAQAATAIENLQLVEDMQRRLLEMADLTWVSSRISSTLDAHSIAATVAQAAAKALDVPHLALFFATPDGECEPVPGGQLGLSEEKDRPLPATDHLGAEALITGTPQTVADAEQEGRQDDALIQWMEARSLVCLPMTAPQGLRGLFVVADRRRRVFTSHEVAVLSAYTNQTALALQSALLHQDVVRHLNQLSQLFQVSQALAGSLELTDVLDTVLTSAADTLGASSGSVSLLDPGANELVMKAARGMPDDILHLRIKLGEGLAGRAAQSGRTLTSADLSRDGRLSQSLRPWARETGAGPAIAAPLIARGSTVGVLSLVRQSSRPFTEDDRQLVTSLANSTALAIDNARLYEEARERAQFLTAMMSETSHRVRNTLQAIAGLLQMAIDHPDERSREDALKRGIARIQSVAVVHEMLRARELQFVDMKRAAGRIAQLTCESLGGDHTVQTRVSGARVMLPSQRAISLAMILGELTDNALRHGLAQRSDGQVTISLAEGGGDVIVEVRDNGPGLHQDFDLDTMSGLGLKVVRGLVEEELGGTLEFETKHGLTVRARFPKQP